MLAVTNTEYPEGAILRGGRGRGGGRREGGGRGEDAGITVGMIVNQCIARKSSTSSQLDAGLANRINTTSIIRLSESNSGRK